MVLINRSGINRDVIFVLCFGNLKIEDKLILVLFQYFGRYVDILSYWESYDLIVGGGYCQCWKYFQ